MLMKAGNKNSCAMLWVQVSKFLVVKVDPKPSIKAYRIAYVAINQIHCCLIQQMSIHDLDNCKHCSISCPISPGARFCINSFHLFHSFSPEVATNYTQKKTALIGGYNIFYQQGERLRHAKDTFLFVLCHVCRHRWATREVCWTIHFQHLIAVPMDMNVPNVPPPCSITLPTLWISSRPLRPYLRAEKPPKSAPDAMPTQNPIVKPIFTRSQQLGPRW